MASPLVVPTIELLQSGIGAVDLWASKLRSVLNPWFPSVPTPTVIYVVGGLTAPRISFATFNCDASRGPFTVLLPDGSELSPGFQLTFTKVDPTGNVVTIMSARGQYINPALSQNVSSVTLQTPMNSLTLKFGNAMSNNDSNWTAA